MSPKDQATASDSAERIDRLVTALQSLEKQVRRLADHFDSSTAYISGTGFPVARMPRAKTSESPLLDLRKASAYSGIPTRTLRQIVQRSRRRADGICVHGGTIQFHQDRPGSRILFKPQWLDDYIAATTVDPTAPKTKVQIAKEKRRGENGLELVKGEHINFDYVD